MIKRVLLTVLATTVTVSVYAATPNPAVDCPAPFTPSQLAYFIPQLYGQNGLAVCTDVPTFNGQSHSAHFSGAFENTFATAFNTALASALVSLPLPSAASAFTYEFDPSAGVFKRSTQSFGPILSDRAETVGKGKLSLGFTFQHFTFDSIDGLSLSNIPALLAHQAPSGLTGRQCGGSLPAFFCDEIETENSLALTLDQFDTFLNYGLADRVDIALAIPFSQVSMSASGNATILPIGSAATNPFTHYFGQSFPQNYDYQTFSLGTVSKFGLGDVTARIKVNALHSGGSGVAIGADVRLPTGDDKNFLGSGAFGLRPFAVVSYAGDVVSPHLKIAYDWSGKSLLAGDVLTNTKGSFPDQWLYQIGADVAVAKRATLALEFMGRRVINGYQTTESEVSVTDFNGNIYGTYPSVTLSRASFNVFDGSAGIKANLVGRLLLDVNLLFKLNNAGLRSKGVTPLVGIEYAF